MIMFESSDIAATFSHYIEQYNGLLAEGVPEAMGVQPAAVNFMGARQLGIIFVSCARMCSCKMFLGVSLMCLDRRVCWGVCFYTSISSIFFCFRNFSERSRECQTQREWCIA